MFGILFGLLTSTARRKFPDVEKKTAVWLVLTLASLSCVAGYFFWIFSCKQKPECNDIHAYVSFLPVLALHNSEGAILSQPILEYVHKIDISAKPIFSFV
jgi:hypothetical protein